MDQERLEELVIQTLTTFQQTLMLHELHGTLTTRRHCLGAALDFMLALTHLAEECANPRVSDALELCQQCVTHAQAAGLRLRDHGESVCASEN